MPGEPGYLLLQQQFHPASFELWKQVYSSLYGFYLFYEPEIDGPEFDKPEFV